MNVKNRFYFVSATFLLFLLFLHESLLKGIPNGFPVEAVDIWQCPWFIGRAGDDYTDFSETAIKEAIFAAFCHTGVFASPWQALFVGRRVLHSEHEVKQQLPSTSRAPLNLTLDSMKLSWSDIAVGTITRWDDNKGKREERVKLHPVVVEHLRKLAGFDPYIFAWNRNMRFLYSEFARIQEQAGIKKPCRGEHEHTRFCHVFGFHDLRRAFATMNADRLTPDALQALMRHESYLTTQRYIAISRQMDAAVESLHVPDVLKSKKA